MVMDISEYLDAAPIQVDINTSIHRVLHLFKSLGLRCCLVSKGGKLQGIITRKDLLYFIQDHEKSFHQASGIIEAGDDSDDDEPSGHAVGKSEAVVRVRASARPPRNPRPLPLQ
uniref:CBS domain-containing protein n=1 Tax=Eutreptiella gymnastica TaxID=73025 RepID=A0A7S4FRE7_9EUGL